jgi:hypothetical protein
MKASELKQDNRNANAGTKRGRKMVSDSLREFGAGRSVLVDEMTASLPEINLFQQRATCLCR